MLSSLEPETFLSQVRRSTTELSHLPEEEEEEEEEEEKEGIKKVVFEHLSSLAMYSCCACCPVFRSRVRGSTTELFLFPEKDEEEGIKKGSV